jgi:hypothetical protein
MKSARNDHSTSAQESPGEAQPGSFHIRRFPYTGIVSAIGFDVTNRAAEGAALITINRRKKAALS